MLASPTTVFAELVLIAQVTNDPENKNKKTNHGHGFYSITRSDFTTA